MDFVGEEDFSFYCPVCDREISAPEIESTAPIASPALSSTSKVKTSTSKSIESNGGLGPRRKSSTRLSSSKGKGHGRTKSKSHVNKSGLAASTPLVPAPSADTPAPVDDTSVNFNPPSSLYCSTECARIDELRSRLSFADLGPVATNSSSFNGSLWKGKGQEVATAMSRRRSSGVSQKSSNSASSDYFSQLQQPPPTDYSSLPSLDFSTRRSSKGSEGGYSYRPAGRLSSDDGGSSAWGYARTRGSSDSLASMNGDSDERSTAHVRPPSALSSLRFMTPISPVQSNSRLTLVRANTDHGSLSPSKDSRTLPGPPLPSPRLLDPSARSESDPGDYLDMPPPPLPSSLTTNRPYSFSSSYNTTPRNPSRSLSSASLALMGTSLTGSYTPASVERGNWMGPKRSESTASLSGLVAIGKMASDSSPRGRGSSGANSRGSPASSASTSSFPRSQSSARSTAGSSDWHPVSDHNRSTSPVPTRSQSKGRRTKGGLLMTPSASSISSSYEAPLPSFDRLVSRDSTHGRNMSKEEKTPTQSYISTGIKTRLEEVEKTVRRKKEEGRKELDLKNGLETKSSIRSPSPAATLLRGPIASPNLSRNGTITLRRESFNAEEVASIDTSIPGRKNWSWDGVGTYAALDVEKVRRGKVEITEVEGMGERKKRLFYFNDE